MAAMKRNGGRPADCRAALCKVVTTDVAFHFYGNVSSGVYVTCASQFGCWIILFFRLDVSCLSAAFFRQLHHPLSAWPLIAKKTGNCVDSIYVIDCYVLAFECTHCFTKGSGRGNSMA